MNKGLLVPQETKVVHRKHGLAPLFSGPAARRRCLARSRYCFSPWEQNVKHIRAERLATGTTRPAAAGSRGFDEGHRWLPGQRLVAQCSSTHSTAEEMMQSANQILHQLEAAGAATHAAQHAASIGSIVSGYASSTGSMSSTVSRDSRDSRDSGDSLSSMDEYSGSALDFSDLANEDAVADAGKGEGTSGGYGKANYEVLRLDATARARRFFVRRRDLLREHRLQPRDLRRIDPSIDFTKTSPSITIKEDVLLLNLGGVRAIVTAEKALLFEPLSATTRKFLEVVLPRLQTHGRARQQAAARGDPAAYVNVSHADYMARFYYQGKFDSSSRTPPFELEVLEGALMVAVGRLDAEMSAVTDRVSALLTKLPGDITPVNLEELRRVKQALVELEDKADTLREMLEELMDDEDELRELNLSSRPRREDRRRQRERNRLEREVERAREIKEELEERALDDGQPITAALPPTPPLPPPPAAAAPMVPPSSPDAAAGGGGSAAAASGPGGVLPYGPYGPGAPPLHGASLGPGPRLNGYGGGLASAVGMNGVGGYNLSGLSSGLMVVRGPGGMGHGGLAAAPPPPPPFAAGGGLGPAGYPAPGPYGSGNPATTSRQERLKELRTKYDRERLRELRARFGWVREGRDNGAGGPGGARGGLGLGLNGGGGGAAVEARKDERERDRDRRKELIEEADFMSRLGDSEEDLQEAQDALEEMVEEEEEEAELEEVEDLLEFYLQRASGLQSEAERMLAGARDLEESIGVSLSARRYEVNRLELMLSIGSFAAAIGAMLAGIFGMNMRSNLEHSALSFWGITAAIVMGCLWIFFAVMRYTRSKRIL
ncbi:hypothetical protein PLESTB_000495700 [Pleodorina starrii]|uniref:Magnesium transporter n=1 Tax=Pleodorina starrii TaxID=330485 RepID=A0A9W6BFS3_9CHLO|nr:hypothetical protein PLESTM_000367100 [Pleodorina starrii]GLC51377.1 hypothetical protein PLESTB_000495700 [Pleodorina starrii]GLC63742.1 hypothetical protein PLESTF_000069200 [Pleodorina starrii]